MGLETGTYTSDLVATNPVGASDPKSQGDDHIRLIKSTIKATFPNVNGAVTGTPAQLNKVAATFLAIHGGTGISSYTAGDMLRALNTTTLEKRTAAQVRGDIGADNATNLASGTVADARLSSNVPLKNATATISASWTFTGADALLIGTDNKELRFGTGGDDLAIYHDGANNFIDSNTGSLTLTAGTGSARVLSSAAPFRITAADGCRMSIYTAAFAAERMYWGFPTDGSNNAIMRNIAGDSIAFRVAGNATRLEIVTDGISIPSNVRFTGAISPAQIVANTDNYNPTGLATASVLRLSTDASRNLTGIVAQAAGTRLLLCNIGAFNLVLVHDATSTAANRFLLPASASLTIIPNAAFEVWYDTTSSRWRSVGGT